MGSIFLLSLVAGGIVVPAPAAEPPSPSAGPPTPRVSSTRAFAPTGSPGIVARTWRLHQINGETVTPEVLVRLENGGRATGTTGCNRFSAEYELDGGSLRFVPPLPRPLLVCAPAVGSLESRVRDSLLRVNAWTITPAGDLSLELNGGGNLVFRAI